MLDSLTSEQAEGFYRTSLNLLCDQVLKSRSPKMPFTSDCGPWPGMQVPTASLLGLVLLGEGNTLMKGPQAATLRKLVAFVKTTGPAEHESIDNYRTWVLSFSLLFLSEIQRIAPAAEQKRIIQEMVRKLEAGAYDTGGFGHTIEKQRNTYGAFTAVTLWAVAGLQAARVQGITVDEKKLALHLQWLRQSVGTSGGGFYAAGSSTLVSPGRTAGVLWLLHQADREASQKQIDLAAAFIERHVAFTPEGHSSGLMNFTWGALAAQCHGGKLRDAFWKEHTRSLYAARKIDGSFSPQPWRDLGFLDRQDTEPIAQKAKQPTADETAGDAWAGVWMLTAWQAARGKSLLCGDGQAKEKPPAKARD